MREIVFHPPLRSGGGGGAKSPTEGATYDGGRPLRLDALRLLATSPAAQGRKRS